MIFLLQIQVENSFKASNNFRDDYILKAKLQNCVSAIGYRSQQSACNYACIIISSNSHYYQIAYSRQFLMLPMNSFQMGFNLGKCKLKTKIKASDTLPFTYD